MYVCIWAIKQTLRQNQWNFKLLTFYKDELEESRHPDLHKENKEREGRKES